MSETKLLPCPFCGNKAELIFSEPGREDRIWVKVKCSKDDCFAANSNYWHYRADEAIAAWNTRAGDERECN